MVVVWSSSWVGSEEYDEDMLIEREREADTFDVPQQVRLGVGGILIYSLSHAARCTAGSRFGS